MRLLYVFCWYIPVFDVLFEIFLKEFRWSLSATLIKFLDDTSNITYSRSAGFKISFRSRPTHPLGCGTTLTHEGRLKRRPLEQFLMRSFMIYKCDAFTFTARWISLCMLLGTTIYLWRIGAHLEEDRCVRHHHLLSKSCVCFQPVMSSQLH